MRRAVAKAFAKALCVGVLAGGVGLSACMSSEDLATDSGEYGSSSGYGAYGQGGSGYGSTSSSGAPIAPPPGSGGAGGEGGTPACESLDQSQPLVLYLSADDSNSMASPAHAREALNKHSTPAAAIRTYEFLNYYNIDYPAPPAGTLNLFADLEPAVELGNYDMQLAVRSFDATLPRRPMTITFVLDTSGSMSGASITRERAVVRAVASSLAAGDIVSMVTWSTSQSAVLSGHIVSGPDDALLLQAADGLGANGGTNLHGGLVAGYQLAQDHYGADRLNRVMLVSDGGANVGVTDKDLIAKHSEDADQEGIYLVGVGTGPVPGYNDALMDTVTDEGRGAYVYVDSEEEAVHMFHDRFDETMEVAARGVQVELTLPWYFQMHKFYGEEYSPNPEEVQPQHLAPSDAMIFAQVLKACDPAVVDPTDTVTLKATWETPLTYEVKQKSATFALSQLLDGEHSRLHKGQAIVAYAEALKTGLPEDLSSAHDLALQNDPNGTDAELSEIASLIEKHPSYQP